MPLPVYLPLFVYPCCPAMDSDLITFLCICRLAPLIILTLQDDSYSATLLLHPIPLPVGPLPSCVPLLCFAGLTPLVLFAIAPTPCYVYCSVARPVRYWFLLPNLIPSSFSYTTPPPTNSLLYFYGWDYHSMAVVLTYGSVCTFLPCPDMPDLLLCHH